MKKARIRILALLTMALVIMSAFAAQAATKKPVAPKKVYMNIFKSISPIDGSIMTNIGGEMFIKNLSKKAKVKMISGEESLYKIYNPVTKQTYVAVNPKSIEFDITDPETGEVVGGGSEGEMLPAGTRKNITFQIKQNKKTYELSTTLVWRYYPYPHKNIKIGGKKIANNFKKTGSFPTYTLGKNKHPKITFSVKKGVLKGEVLILRGGKMLRYSKVKKLKKGDIIYLQFLEKHWEKYQGFEIPVV